MRRRSSARATWTARALLPVALLPMALLPVAMLALAACGPVHFKPRAASPAAPAPEGTRDAPAAGEQAVTKLPLTALPSGPIPAASDLSSLNTQVLSQVSPPTLPADLPLGPGELLEISVFEVPELSNLKVRVPLDGKIKFPLLGIMTATGLTPVQLEEEIRERLEKRYLHDPQVSVFVLEQRSHKISVIGAVRKGGVYSYTGNLRLADALAMAEGLTEESDHVIYLIRRLPRGSAAGEPPGESPSAAAVGTRPNEVRTAVDLEALAAGRNDLNVPLQAGDVVLVPRAGSYYVGGEVQKPGTFTLKSRTTLDRAIVSAGGVNNLADWADIKVYRNTGTGGETQEVLTFDLNEIALGKPAPPILKHDVILVGKHYAKAFTQGILEFAKGIFSVGVGVSRGF